MAKLLKGKEIVEKMSADLVARVEALAVSETNPTLAILRMGERPDDLSYERSATKRAESLGIAVRSIVLPEDAPWTELEAALREVNADSSIHGCLMFRPLPPHIDEAVACALLDAGKDVDGITPASLASVFSGEGPGYPPATAQACIEVLDHYGIALEGKRVAVIVRSLVIGKPVAMLALERNATVTLCHSRTADLPAVCRAADIVVCATGRARAYGADYFSAGQTVLDVGINFDEEGRLCGDVDLAAVEPVVDAITPVPGGLGAVTTITLMSHVVRAAQATLR